MLMTTVDDLTQSLDQLQDSLTRTAQVAPQVARQEIRREGRPHDLGVQANAELTRRGLTPVPTPAPGTASGSQVLTAANQAEVAAKIARESSAAVQAYLAANPQGLRGELDR
jgi:hypothetical protein